MQATDANLGILGLEVYFPSTYVEQEALEKYDGVSQGKYTVGLGQKNMGFCSDREDINSVALTAVQSLMEKYDVPYEKIGRLEVGTETVVDKSKAVKTTLMALFAEHDNHDIEGIDTTNACYGGTAAVFNALAWLGTEECDGRYAIVVAADIAVYEAGPARPTGGCGAVAVLLGPDSPIVFELGTRASYMADVYDFFKPHLGSEYPEVDGALSQTVYTTALDHCYSGYRRKAAAKLGVDVSTQDPAYLLFHCPYCKLVQKSVGRLLYNDFKNSAAGDERFAALEGFRGIDPEASLVDRDLEKAAVKASADLFKEKTDLTLECSREIGNTYTASLWFSIVSTIANATDSVVGKQLLCFSYGSGLAATMFSLNVVGSVAHIAEKINLHERLAARVAVPPAEYTQVLALREQTYGLCGLEVSSSLQLLQPGTFYLVSVDEMGRRKYARKPIGLGQQTGAGAVPAQSASVPTSARL